MAGTLDPLFKMTGGKLLEPGSIVLVRGSPGTGKTTLALQIVERHLASAGDTAAAFVSLEKPPSGVLRHLKNAFGIDLGSYAGGQQRLVLIPRERFFHGATRHQDDPHFAAWVIQEVAKETQKLCGRANTTRDKVVVLIDSLNILADFVAAWRTAVRLRTVLYNICSAMQENFKEAVVLATGEHDPLNPRALSVGFESFFSDTLIELRAETLAPRAAGPQQQPGALEIPARQAPGGGERRHFCRVLKCRTGARQERRCAYDFVNRHGIVFYETYPADGQIMLFAENAPQRAAWGDFFQRDIPRLYPALDCESFGRSALQRVFASQRRLRHIPERRNMNLASYDTYWINWYVELCQRMDIAELFRSLNCSQGEKDGREAFSQIVGKAHRCLTCQENPPTAQGFADMITGDVCREQQACRENGEEIPDCPAKLREAYERATAFIKSEEGQAGLLHPLPWNELRLFGERRSKIIAELQTEVPDERRPVFRPNHRQRPEGTRDAVLAVPYDANISFLVVRDDLWSSQIEHIDTNQAVDDLTDLHRNEQEDLTKAFPDHENQSNAKEVNGHIAKLIGSLREHRYPETWEELIVLCEKANAHFLIETQTFDTVLCTLLEMVWGCGGQIRVLPDYEIEVEDETEMKLFQAFWLLQTMFRKGVIPPNSSLEPDILARRFTPRTQKGGSETPERDWLFARHWYSTLTDVLTARDPRDREFIWRPGEIRLRIAPIPVSLNHYLEKTQQGQEPIHCSCWGEWYLAVMKGTENEALALDLINNLMSGRKVSDRAFACASVPTTDYFYTLYNDSPCFNLPERTDITLPETTFGQLRETFFAHARSRTQVFDYRHCLRELHAVLLAIQTNRSMKPRDLRERISHALAEIKNLAKKEVLLK